MKMNINAVLQIITALLCHSSIFSFSLNEKQEWYVFIGITSKMSKCVNVEAYFLSTEKDVLENIVANILPMSIEVSHNNDM